MRSHMLSCGLNSEGRASWQTNVPDGFLLANFSSVSVEW